MMEIEEKEGEQGKVEAGNDVEMMDRTPDESEVLDGPTGEIEEESQNMFELINDVSRYLCSVEEDGEDLAAGFQRLPNRRLLPDYFDIIAVPVAFSTIRGKVQKKQYTAFPEFVKDVAQIFHNAQVYNRPSAPIFGAAERLREIFKTELQKLIDKGDLSPDDAKLPDLGELPPAEESPPTYSDDDEMEEEAEEEDDQTEDEEDESDSEGYPRRRRRRGRQVALRRRRTRDDDYESHKTRGRPPMVLTPIQSRIFSILKGLRTIKNEKNDLLIHVFEKLPDKSEVPGYYETITNPIALDSIKKKAKRKKYSIVDQVLADLNLMFENAKQYNEDGSEVYQAAVQLQQQALILAQQEKDKPDDDFRDEDGKLALSDIFHKGERWRVGDWVHIRNPNDLAKPIVAQIFRTWQDRAGQRWINACWYYRPEQTVHRHEKHFFQHEVFKTWQYRDHQIEEVIDRCFVMFVTRFNKGRPRGLPVGKDIYVCESRYNEEKFRFNKIKTWASCVPDEVRERDYEMYLFDQPRPMKKIPSPIKHLLREDAKDSDELPRPTWGSPNAPPIVGAVHRRPLEPNESPPPGSGLTGTPAATDLSLESIRATMLPASRDSLNDSSIRTSPAATLMVAGASPSPGPYHSHPTPHFQSVTQGTVGPPIHQTPVPIPYPPQQTGQPPMSLRPMQFQHHQQATYTPNFVPAYPSSPAVPMHHQAVSTSRPVGYNQAHLPPPRPPITGVPSATQPHMNMYNPPRPPEVYTLPENLNDSLPTEVQQVFQHDRTGRILFFTAPPLERLGNGLSPTSSSLGHSIKYLAGRGVWLAERERKRMKRDRTNELESEHHNKGKKTSQSSVANLEFVTTEAMEKWTCLFEQETDRWEQQSGLKGWEIPVKTQSEI